MTKVRIKRENGKVNFICICTFEKVLFFAKECLFAFIFAKITAHQAYNYEKNFTDDCCVIGKYNHIITYW